MRSRVRHSLPWLPLFGCLLILSSCAKQQDDPNAMGYVELLGQLFNPERVARLDTLPIDIETSYDRTGRNDDFNNFSQEGPDGWVVLADLKGPGYVSRFWFTGADGGEHKLRFYFDGEKTPRLETTLGEFCGGQAPFVPPLASYDNYCWYSFVPLPYSRSLKILAQEGNTRAGGWPRIFYQVEHSALPEGRSIKSFPKQLSAEHVAAIEAIQSRWREKDYFQDHANPTLSPVSAQVPAGSSATLHVEQGPGVLRELRFSLDLSAYPTAVARAQALRDLVFRITWNGSDQPSVDVPFGDFFGSFWRRTAYQSMFFGMEGDEWYCRFPMPFETSAKIELVNQGSHEISCDGRVTTETISSWDASWGYFHAQWNRSEPKDVGKPHAILNAAGKGHYVGCILGVASLDKSWWILEGDEIIKRDGELTPSWKGTGLEDYFNGGWYYQNAHARPMHGLPFKAPFRAVQYRMHMTGPVAFNSFIDMIIERGPDNASHGWIETVAFYYTEKPAAASSKLRTPPERIPPADPLVEGTLMSELANAERLGDYKGASEYIDMYLEQYPTFPFAPVLRLRQIAYRERTDGFPAVKADYEAFLQETTNALALQQAKTLLWFHEDPSNALLGLYCNGNTRIYLDGKGAAQLDDPQRLRVFGLKLPEGDHALALEVKYKQYPSWVQAYLRTHRGAVMTTPAWKWRFDPIGNWSSVQFDDTTWKTLGGNGGKGPPEAPYIWTEPHAYVDMQSQAIGLRTPDDWPDQVNGTVVYRTKFSL